MQTAYVVQANTITQATDYPQQAIVENTGTSTKNVWSDRHTLKAALRELEGCGGTGSDFDLMKCLPDSTLTTEF